MRQWVYFCMLQNGSFLNATLRTTSSRGYQLSSIELLWFLLLNVKGSMGFLDAYSMHLTAASPHVRQYPTIMEISSLPCNCTIEWPVSCNFWSWPHALHTPMQCIFNTVNHSHCLRIPRVENISESCLRYHEASSNGGRHSQTTQSEILLFNSTKAGTLKKKWGLSLGTSFRLQTVTSYRRSSLRLCAQLNYRQFTWMS